MGEHLYPFEYVIKMAARVVRIILGYQLENLGFDSRQRQEILSPKCPDRLCISHSILLNGYPGFSTPGVNL